MEERPRKRKEGQPTRTCGGHASALAQRPGSPGKAGIGGKQEADREDHVSREEQRVGEEEGVEGWEGG